MKSKIYIDEMVENKDRKFGSVLEYYPVRLVDEDDTKFNALFTKKELETALARAEANPEDIPKKTFLESLFG